MKHNDLPIPLYFNPDRIGEVFRVPYQERAADAGRWRKQYVLNLLQKIHLEFA
jgi:hypothetical protein